MLYHLQLTSRDGHVEAISTTGNLPFYSVDSREFVHASKLVVGARLVGIDGRIVAVSSINRELAPAGETFSTYNLEVEDDYTYHVGTAGVWVHNISEDDCLKLAKLANAGDADSFKQLKKAIDDKPKLRKVVAEFDETLLKKLDALEKKGKYRGGLHGDTKGPVGDGFESHHMPAKSVNGLPTDKGPAIHMDPADHALTASNGKQPGSDLYRLLQQRLIKKGKFGEALQMDIDNVRKLFGDKYDEAIREMIDQLEPWMKTGLKG